MADEKIRVQIESEYDDREAREAIRDAEKIEDLKPELVVEADASELDTVKSKADEVADAIKQAATTIDTELRDSAAAADALRLALGDTGSQLDASAVVGELQRMGLSLDEIRLEAGTLADALKFADDLDTERVRSELDGTKTALGGVRDNADQSRSVMANMAGNAAQDLGEINGVAGTLGVGLGQLAEYATEGNISLASLAKVAGPMLALTGALALVTSEAAKQKAEAAATAKAINEYQKAIDDLGPSAEAAAAGLEELTAAAAEPESSGLFNAVIGSVKNLGEEFTSFFEIKPDVVDPVAILGELGYTAEQVAAAMDGGAASFDAFMQQIDRDPRLEGYGRQVETFLTDNMENYTAAVYRAENRSKFFGTTAASSLEDVNTALQDNKKATGDVLVAWDNLLTDLEDGTVDTDLARNAWDFLMKTLGLTEEQMVELTNTNLGEHMAGLAGDTEVATDAFEGLHDALAEAEAGFNTAAGRAAAFDAATQIFRELGDLDTAAQFEDIRSSIQGVKDAFADLEDTDTELIPDTFNEIFEASGQLAPVTAAIETLAGAIDTQLAEAFEVGGAEGLRAAAEQINTGLVPALEAAGLSATQIDEVLAAVGTRDVDITARLQLVTEEKARGLIDAALSGADIPLDMKLNILAQAETDPIGALRALIATFPPAEVPVTLVALLDTWESDVDTATAPRTVDATVESNADDVGDDIDTATEDRTTHVIVPKSPSLGQMETLLNAVARDRFPQYIAKSPNAGAMDGLLDAVANPGGGDRIAHYSIVIDNLLSAKSSLNDLDDPRTVHLHIVEHRHSSGGGGGGGASSQPSSVTNVAMTLPRGTRPDDAVRAIDRYARRNGRTRATRR